MKTYAVTISVVCLDTLEVEVSGVAISQGDSSLLAVLEAMATVIPDLPGVGHVRGQVIGDVLATIAQRERVNHVWVPDR